MLASLAGIAVLGALAACAASPTAARGTSSPSEGGASTRGSAVLSTPAPAIHGLGETAVTLPVHRGPASAAALPGVAWRLGATTAASTALELQWNQRSSGACGAATDVYVDEQQATVVVDVVAAKQRTGVVCPQVLRSVRMTVAIAAPLGSRTVRTHVRAGTTSITQP